MNRKWLLCITIVLRFRLYAMEPENEIQAKVKDIIIKSSSVDPYDHAGSYTNALQLAKELLCKGSFANQDELDILIPALAKLCHPYLSRIIVTALHLMPNPTIAIWIHNKIQQEVKAKDEAEFLLFTCTRDLHMDFIDFLLQAGINIDARDRYGETPLMWAVNYGLVSMVRALLERGASLLIRDSQNRTALERALRQRNDRLQRYQDTQAIDAIITLLENPEKA